MERKPLLVYDGKCSVCVRQVENLKRLLGDRFDPLDFQAEGFYLKHPEFARADCETAVQYRSRSGRIYSGAEAVARALSLRLFLVPLTALYYLPGCRWISDRFYEWIAKNRLRF